MPCLETVLLAPGLGAAAAGDPAPAAAASPDAGTPLYLEVTLNGSAAGLAPFLLAGGELWCEAATLRALHFILPAGQQGATRLTDLPGVQSRYDASRQSVELVAPLPLLDLPTTVLSSSSAERPAADGAKATSSSSSASPSPAGLLLDYSLHAGRSATGLASLNAFTELRAFGGPWVFSSSGLSEAARADAGWKAKWVRLDSSIAASFADSALALRAGDLLTGALSWTRATRLGGVQIARDLGLQPYLAKSPMPVLAGAAAMPSNVELFVNGLKQYGGPVPAGPFRIDAAPSLSGAGQARMVVTDALGRATELILPLYGTPQLLRKGLGEGSLEFGLVRRDFGVRSFGYSRAPVASGTWRSGLTDTATLESHGEIAPGLLNAGFGAAWVPGERAGVVAGALAGSDRQGRRGLLQAAAYEWHDQRLNFGVAGTRVRGPFCDAAALQGGAPPPSQGRALAGWSSPSLGSFSLGLLRLRPAGQPATRGATAQWSRALGPRASLSFGLQQTLDPHRQGSAFLAFSWSPDGRTSQTAALGRDSPGRSSVGVEASRSAPGEGGWGWRTSVRQADGRRDSAAALSWLGRQGQAEAGIIDHGEGPAIYADADGALVAMAGHVFAARRIDQAFAVVSTEGAPDVPVRLENREVGRTDAEGFLLVAPLHAFQDNQIEIDPMKLPADVRVEKVRTVATPGDRSGMLVRFPVVAVQSAMVTLVEESGRPLAVGSRVRVDDRADEGLPVGFDGALYLEGVQEGRHRLGVERPDGTTCQAWLDYRRQPGRIALFGPLACSRAAP